MGKVYAKIFLVILSDNIAYGWIRICIYNVEIEYMSNDAIFWFYHPLYPWELRFWYGRKEIEM